MNHWYVRQFVRAFVGFVVCGVGVGRAETLSLSSAIALALKHNERVEMTGLRQTEAQARVTRARAYFFPSLNVSGTYTRRSTESTGNINTGTGAGRTVTFLSKDALSATAALNLTLFDARSVPLYQQALREHEAATSQARYDRQQIAYEAAHAFMTCLTLQQVVQAAKNRVDLAQQTDEQAKIRFSVQLASGNEVTKSELELAAAQRQFVLAQVDLDKALLELKYFLVAPHIDKLQIPSTLIERAQQPHSAMGDQQFDRQDLDAARWTAQAKRSAALEPLMRLFPSLSFTAQFDVKNETGFSGRNYDWLLQLNAKWTLFDGGIWYAERKERKAAARRAELDLIAMRRRVSKEAQTALLTLTSLKNTRHAAQRVVAAARKNANETALLYRQGLATALDAAQSTAQLFTAEVEMAQEEFGLVIAYLGLRATIGLPPLD